MACLLMRRGMDKFAVVYLQDLTEKHPSIIKYNMALSFLYKEFANKPKLAEKYNRITERVTLRREGEL